MNFKKEKKFKEKEKCGETAVSVLNGYGRFPIYMFLWNKNDEKVHGDCGGTGDDGVLWSEGDRRGASAEERRYMEGTRGGPEAWWSGIGEEVGLVCYGI